MPPRRTSRGQVRRACALRGPACLAAFSQLERDGTEDWEDPDPSGRSSVFAAAEANNVLALRRLALLRVDANRLDIQGTSALHLAASRGNLAAVRHLINERGAEANVANRHGAVAIGLAAWGGKADVVRFLLDAGAEYELRRGGRTPSGFAELTGQTAVVKMIAAEPERRRKLMALAAAEAAKKKAAVALERQRA